MIRSFDGGFLERVMNDPSVLPSISRGKPVLMGHVLEDTNNVFLSNDYGGFLFLKHSPGVYDLHTQFLPEGRGAAVLIAGRDAAWYMFTETDCEILRTYALKSNRAASLMALRAGFIKTGESETYDGEEATLYAMTIKQWARNLCQQPSH